MLKQYAEGLVPTVMVLSNKIFDVKYDGGTFLIYCFQATLEILDGN